MPLTPPGFARVPCDEDEEPLALAVSGFQSAAVPGKRSTGRLGLIDYAGVLTVADPATFSQPWTAALSLKNSDQPDVFEYACHEGNYAMRNILSGARAAEKK